MGLPLHQTVADRCPSLLPLFQKFYSKESLCFFNLDDEVRLLSSAEGARIGCKMSSFGFGHTIQPTYLDVDKYLSGFRDGSCIKAATDDVIICLKATPGQEAELHSRISKVVSIINKGAQRVGLTFTNDKAQLLYPKDWVPGDTTDLPAGLALRSNTFADSSLRGMEVVGSPVGSLDFCLNFIKSTLQEMLNNAASLVELHPQCATKLLRDCVCPAPAYLAQVCHPNLTRDLLAKFDESVWKLWLEILGDTGGDQLSCCPEVLSRSKMRAFLPCRFDGAGLRCWERASEYAWYCSIASCIALRDPDIEFARRFIGKNGEDAYSFAMDALGGPSYLEEHKQVELLPVDEPDVLKQSTFYWNLFIDNKNLKLQQAFHEIVSSRARREFIERSQAHASTGERILLQSLNNSEPGTSILTSLFTAKLSQKDVRLTKTEFILAARQFLLLPTLKNDVGTVVEHLCGCQSQMCSNSTCIKHGEEMDAMGGHAIVCNAGVKAMKATLLEKALEKNFRLAGGKPTPQPPTTTLLGGYFSKDDVSRLFPGKLSKEESEKRKKLALRFLDILQEIPRGQVRTAEIGMLREEFPAPPKNADAGGMRFDLRFPMTKPFDNRRELWFDHAIVQESASSYGSEVLKFLSESRDNEPQASPAFLKMQSKKTRQYSAVMTVAERLLAEHKLDFQPVFLFPVVSALGYMNKDMQQMLKLIGHRFKETQEKESDSEDGVKPEVVKGRFKRALRDSVCFALVKGLALAMHNQGIKGTVNPP